MISKSGFSARNESIRLSLLLACLCVSLLYGDWLWRLDNSIYDAQSSMLQHQANDDIVIIAIDENSLQSIGRWPWPRNIHAELINKLTTYQVRAILLDMILAEPSAHPAEDLQLADAIKRNGTVALPVLLEQTRLRGQLIETLPLPSLTQASASLGHVHVELDQDGIARGSYLYEGLGQARWPHISMALLQAAGESTEPALQRQDRPISDSTNWTWRRQQHFLIPYIGPPGSFQTISYISVLNDNLLHETLKDKIVLIGVTASGLGDSLPTPVSGLSHPMPGIEVNANILQAIQQNTLINSVDKITLYFLSALLIIIPIIIFPYLSPRLNLLLIASEITLLFLISFLLLHAFHLWLPVSAVIVSLLLSYPLWAWRRLEFTVRFLNTELESISREVNSIERYVAENSDVPFSRIQALIPVNGLYVMDKDRRMILKHGPIDIKAKNLLPTDPMLDNWLNFSGNDYYLGLVINDANYTVCVDWKNDTLPDQQQTRILKTYLRKAIKPIAEKSDSTVELIESRIKDIKKTTQKLTVLRHFITDSLDQMADGVIVIDSLGTITLANRNATQFLSDNNDSQLLEESILPFLNKLEISGGESWENIIHSVLANKTYENLQVMTNRGKDLMIHIRPLYSTTQSINGFIINLSDISEIKHAQRKRNEMLSFLSHDLRSPLVSVLAVVEQYKIEQGRTMISDRIEKNIHHTIELAEDFIHLSYVEDNDDISFTSINMPDIVTNAIDTVWDQAMLKEATILQEGIDDAWISGNGSILERVFVNLLSNAIKYCDNNPEIRVELYIENDMLCCELNDNGPGIKQDEIAYLFDRFKRASSGKHKKGIGLGLAFVHAAIEKHNGSIEASSELGVGTKFIIKLPLEQQS